MMVTIRRGVSMAYNCRFLLDGELAAEGQIRVACYRFRDNGDIYAVLLPQELIDDIRATGSLGDDSLSWQKNKRAEK